MSNNTTTSEHVADAHDTDAVSGWSVFWALIAIVTNAMLQESFTGYLWHGTAFRGSLWPHRSSPIICVIDVFADAYLICRAAFDRTSHDRETESGGGRVGTLSRLALFGLGVLPQAIKLITMRGIPITQTIAAMYLLPSLLSLVRSIVSRAPEEDLPTLLGELVQNEKDSDFLLKAQITIIGWAPPFMGAAVFWYIFSDRVGFSAPPEVAHVVVLVDAITKTLLILYTLQHIIFTLLQRRSPIPNSPMLIVCAYTNMFSVSDLVALPGQRAEEALSGRWQVVLPLLTSHCLACYVCTSIPYIIVKWVRKRGKSPATGGNNAPSAGRSSHPESSPTERRARARCPHHHRATQTDLREAAAKPRSAVDLTDCAEPVRQATQQSSSCTQQLPHISSNGGGSADSTAAVPSGGASAITPEPDATQRREHEEPPLNWRLTMLYIPLFGFVLFWLALGWIISCFRVSEPDKAADEHNIAERGAGDASTNASTGPLNQAGGGSQNVPDARNPLRKKLRATWVGVCFAFHRVSRSVMVMAGRIWLAVAALYFSGLESLWVQVTERYPIKILVNAFGLFNFSLAVLYYLVYFDEEGTSAPGWSEVFGR